MKSADTELIDYDSLRRYITAHAFPNSDPAFAKIVVDRIFAQRGSNSLRLPDDELPLMALADIDTYLHEYFHLRDTLRSKTLQLLTGIIDTVGRISIKPTWMENLALCACDVLGTVATETCTTFIHDGVLISSSQNIEDRDINEMLSREPIYSRIDYTRKGLLYITPHQSETIFIHQPDSAYFSSRNVPKLSNTLLQIVRKTGDDWQSIWFTEPVMHVGTSPRINAIFDQVGDDHHGRLLQLSVFE